MKEKLFVLKPLRKERKIIIRHKAHALVHINSTLTNTFITITNKKGDVKFRTTAGACGFKASRRSTKHAALIAGILIGRKAKRKGIRYVVVYVKGLGRGKQSSVKGLYKSGLRPTFLYDMTPIPFNGCQLRKPKRKKVRINKKNKKRK